MNKMNPATTDPLPGPLRAIATLFARPLSRLPHGVQRHAAEALLNRVFGKAAKRGELDDLAGRRLVLEISDLGWRWPLTVHSGRILLAEHEAPAAATIRGNGTAFAAIALALADPDTLFFRRRLSIEGDTELGLAVKNFLAGFDPQDIPAPYRQILSAAGNAAIKIARLASEAVSARSVRGPSPAGSAPDRSSNANSAAVHPPSGPTINATGPVPATAASGPLAPGTSAMRRTTPADEAR